MAKLNDPPLLAAESLDSLKRRFIRQNREIAKYVVFSVESDIENRSNSNQSLKIRGLESEVSRLLADNAALQSRILHLEARERLSNAAAWDRLDRVKDGLQTKLSDISALLQDLGQIQHQAARDTRPHTVSPLAQGPPPRRRQKPEVQDIETGTENRMPVIPEDLSLKNSLYLTPYYDEEANDGMESPDLGPPPIAHLEGLHENNVESPPRSEKTIDKRKRRRESFQFRQGLAEEAQAFETENLQIRKNLDTEKTRAPPRTSQEISAVPKFRKALTPKSVNTDPQSPAKIVKLSKQKIPREGMVPKQHPDHSIVNLPQTPINAELDILSPLIVTPGDSAARDTPPPTELGKTQEGFARVSRRSRGTVSYAEPSLRDKMRRPTKQLVDAVSNNDNMQQHKVKSETPDGEDQARRLDLSNEVIHLSTHLKWAETEDDRRRLQAEGQSLLKLPPQDSAPAPHRRRLSALNDAPDHERHNEERSSIFDFCNSSPEKSDAKTIARRRSTLAAGEEGDREATTDSAHGHLAKRQSSIESRAKSTQARESRSLNRRRSMLV